MTSSTAFSRSTVLLVSAMLLGLPVCAQARSVIGDFDGDGQADVFWRHRASGENRVWRFAGSGATVSTPTVADANWRVQGRGDFDGDQQADVLWRNVRTGANAI